MCVINGLWKIIIDTLPFLCFILILNLINLSHEQGKAGCHKPQHLSLSALTTFLDNKFSALKL